VTVAAPHSWSVTPQRAVEIQEQLASLVERQQPSSKFRLVAGSDCSYTEDDSRCAAAIALWDIERRTVVETRTAISAISFPYIPGLLAFREAPAVLQVLQLLTLKPQLLLCDGHGLAHPRRFGLACHLGVLTGLAAVGCAKRRLVGTFIDPDRRRGSKSALLDQGEVVGTVLRTRTAVKPVFVSIGHRVDLSTAERIVLACTGRYRLPEPLRAAHRLSKKALYGD
jgi:deoxyribonuclease V